MELFVLEACYEISGGAMWGRKNRIVVVWIEDREIEDSRASER